MYTIETYTKTIPLTEYISKYVNSEKVGGYCKKCPNYGRNFACPPHNFELDNFFKKYDTIDLTLKKIIPSDELKNKEYTKQKEIEEAVKKTLGVEENIFRNELLKKEKLYRVSKVLAPPCNICGSFCMDKYDECQHPELMRYSIDSTCGDTGKILKELFDYGIKFIVNNEMPEYLTLLAGLMYQKDSKI
ncbi:MAG: DUF2284 domain-containing protein [Methanobacteriaceae archaeon]|nr:DUF2284 domain-containing protein [Methanobacteriaceae archaeon]